MFCCDVVWLNNRGSPDLMQQAYLTGQVVVVRPAAELCLNVCFSLAFRVFWVVGSACYLLVTRQYFVSNGRISQSGHFGGYVRACPF